MKSSRPFMFALLFCCFTLLIVALPTHTADSASRTIFVATNGNDETGTGSIDKPYATLGKAGRQAKAGDVIAVRAGIYRKNAYLKTTGAPHAWITVMPYKDETVIFDGSTLDLDATTSLIQIAESKYVVFAGFTVRNSNGRGLSYYESEHIHIRDNTVHDIDWRGIGGGGSYIEISHNDLWHIAMANKNARFYHNPSAGTWPGAITTWLWADGSLSRNINIHHNTVRDSWGEGIIPLFTDGVRIENNTIHNVFSTGIYVNATRNAWVMGNFVYATTNAYNRPDRDVPANGITLANERVRSEHPTLDNIVVANNLLVGNGHGVNFWFDTGSDYTDNTYRNVTIAHNVIHDAQDTAVRFNPINTARYNPPRNARLHNNIIYQGGNGKTLELHNLDAWRVTHNNWPDGTPAEAQHSSNNQLQPAFVNPTIQAGFSGFHLQDSSPLIGAGSRVTSVLLDYRGAFRPNRPTIGLYEGNPVVLDEQVFLPMVNR